MAKTPIAASWTANSTSPYADQSYPNGDRPSGGGGTETITGSGFGTLNMSNIYFSNEALSSLADTDPVPSAGLGGFSSVTSGSRLAVTMSSDAKARGSNLSILCGNSGDNNGAANSTLLVDMGSGVAQNTKIFWSSWDRMTPRSALGGDGQWKMRRFATNNSITDNDSELVLFRTDEDSGNNALNYSLRTGTGTVNHSAQSGGTINNNNMPQFDDTWRRIDQFIDTGTDNTYDGDISIVGHWPDGSSIPSLLTLVEFDATAVWPDQEKVYGDSGDRWRYCIHQNFFGNGTGTEPLKNFGADVRHDHVYIQIGSFKRVELCNTSSLATATVREIAYPTAWSDASVTVDLQYTGLASGTYYLHVIDEDGTSLANKEVTI